MSKLSIPSDNLTTAKSGTPNVTLKAKLDSAYGEFTGSLLGVPKEVENVIIGAKSTAAIAKYWELYLKESVDGMR